jgi:hypothetical protein
MKNVKFWGPLLRDHEEIVALIYFFLKKGKRTLYSKVIPTNHSELSRAHTHDGPM